MRDRKLEGEAYGKVVLSVRTYVGRSFAGRLRERGCIGWIKGALTD